MSQRCVLHVCRTPQTGVWSVIKALAAWQRSQGKGPVALGVIGDRTWGQVYREEFRDLPFDRFLTEMPFVFNGTLTALSHLVWAPVAGWVRDLQRTHGSDVVVHFHNAWLSGAYLPIKSLPGRVATVTTFHGITDLHKLRKRPWQNALHKMMAQRLVTYHSTLASVDGPNTTVAQELFGISPDAFEVVPNGVPRGLPEGSVRPPRRGPFHVGFIALMSEGKGWRLTAAAVDRLAREGHDVKLSLAGAGPDDEIVRAWAADRPDRVEYLGYVREAGKTITPQLDALVLPSTAEGMPMVVIEALSWGTPVIATRVGGLPQVIEEGINGFLVERNEQAIADRLREWMVDPTLHQRMSAQALASFERSFSIDACGERYDRLYAKALMSKSP